MPRVFLIHHLKRSGGHAVANWMQESEKGSVFFNNDIPIQPILTGRKLMPDGSRSLDDWARGKTPGATRAIEHCSTLFVSLEDHKLDVRPFQHSDMMLIVILRHPENLFASRIRKASNSSLKAYDYEDSQILARTVQLWKEHARLALGLAGAPLRHVGLLYDAWLVSEDYREGIARELRLSAPRPLSGRMTSEGGGSSFAEATVDASSLRRRADLLDDLESDVLRQIMADPEMRELADRATEIVQKFSAAN
jgi:hypothetical protein